MPNDLIRHNRPVSDELHPAVYIAVIGLTVGLIFAAWGFDAGGDIGYLLVIVSGLVLFAIAIPAALWYTWRNAQRGSDHEHGSYRSWASGEFETWQGSLRGTEAAAQVLLPVAAVALCMTALAIVLHFTALGTQT
jgi:hypothetical protein